MKSIQNTPEMQAAMMPMNDLSRPSPMMKFPVFGWQSSSSAL
ncbi:MAG TPA: hypothetical protein VJ761_04580 [Ktedonobacteraceae bacterium]|nr:hypothetical protein [Ktedonobacteraceae bacterium]